MHINDFLRPKNEYKGIPFWCWNGKLDRKTLLEQLSVFKQMGMGGAFCHSRTGLETPYLEDEWFSLINDCAEKATELGMSAWIYDEDRWPSGTAGGKVTKNPKYRLHFIRAKVIPFCEYKSEDLPKDTIAVFSADMDGMEFTNLSPINDISGGNSILVFSIEQMKLSSNYNGYTYVDTMNEEATEEFIKETHEKYLEKCNQHIGKNIVGVFTDEPHRGALMCGFAIDNDNPEYLTPYTSDLFEIFEKRMGYSLKEKLPELFFFNKGQEFSKVKYDYVETLLELFKERYLKPISKWCNEHNLKLTGHMLHEDRLAAQVCMAGSLMRTYEDFDIPGVDVLERNNRSFWIVKQLQSVARQFGKKWLLSEMFGVTGWQTTLEDQKNICDWQMLFGINQRCQHLSWYTMKGEAKRDYPASISSQSYWHRNYSYVEDYFSRVAYFRHQGAPLCDVLVLNPIESLYGIVYPGWADNALQAVDERVRVMEKNYKDVFHTLMGTGADFDYADEEQLSRIGSVSGNKIVVGEMAYKTVLIPYMTTIRKSTLNLLHHFISQGGKVVVIGDAPEYASGESAKESILSALKNAEFTALSDFSKAMTDYRPLDIMALNGEKIDKIYVQANKLENGVGYMLLNTDLENDITFKIGKRKFANLEKWDARSGCVTTLSYSADEEVTITLSVGEELLLVETEINNEYPAAIKFASQDKVVTNQTQFNYILAEPNVCVLDNARYAIGDGEYNDRTEVLKIDSIIRDKLGIQQRGGEMLQPWYRNLYGDNSAQKTKRELLRMEFSFIADIVPASLKVAIESPQQFRIFLNGHIGAVSYTDASWVDKCFSVLDVDISVLKKGKNTITLETIFDTNSNLENIYLLGDFGVRLDGRNAILCNMPDKLSVGDIAEQGFPFYGAGITYYIDCPAIDKNNTLTLDLKESAATGYVVSHGKNKDVVAFSPKVTDVTDSAGNTLKIEYLFTRRNTFGPFHQNPPDFNNCNPTSFRTEGDEYLEDAYVLIPQGMLKPIEFYENSTK